MGRNPINISKKKRKISISVDNKILNYIINIQTEKKLSAEINKILTAYAKNNGFK